MNWSNSVRQLIAVTFAILLGCSSCCARPVFETPAPTIAVEPGLRKTVVATAAVAAVTLSTTPIPSPVPSPTPSRVSPWRSSRQACARTTPRPYEPVWQAASQTLGIGSVQDVAVSPDGKTLAVATTAGMVIYRTDTFERVRMLRRYTRFYARIAFSPDSKTLASWSHNSSVILWDVATGEKARVLGHAGIVRGVGFAPDGVARAVIQSGDAAPESMPLQKALVEELSVWGE